MLSRFLGILFLCLLVMPAIAQAPGQMVGHDLQTGMPVFDFSSSLGATIQVPKLGSGNNQSTGIVIPGKPNTTIQTPAGQMRSFYGVTLPVAFADQDEVRALCSIYEKRRSEADKPVCGYSMCKSVLNRTCEGK